MGDDSLSVLFQPSKQTCGGVCYHLEGGGVVSDARLHSGRMGYIDCW